MAARMLAEADMLAFGDREMDFANSSRTGATLQDRYQVLLRVSQVLRSYRDCDNLLGVLPTELSRVIQWNFLGITLHDERTRRMQPHELKADGSRFDDYLAEHFAADETLSWWVYQQQEPLVIPCVEKEERFPRLMKFLQEHGMRSACCVPLTAIHHRLGGFSVASERLDAYSEEEVRFLSLLADQVALAIEDTLNFEASRIVQAESKRERDRLRLLLDLNSSIASNLDRDTLLRAVLTGIRRLTEIPTVGIYLPDSEKKRLNLYADLPDRKGSLVIEHSLTIGDSESPPVKVFQTGKPIVASPPAQAYQRPKEYPVAGDDVQSWCMLPLMTRKRVLGVLALGRSREISFSQNDVEFLTQVTIQVALALDNALTHAQSTDARNQLALEKLYLEDEIRSEMHFEQIVGKSAPIRRVLQQVETVAPTDSTVLILGETGTGKELIARAIHNRSRRKDRTFVKLNCAAIPTGLLESELFGHEKGAFTGAISQRVGRFELAHQGTIFLDEIGEIALDLQPKLLRVLQDQEFERLGGTKTIRTDARLIAATNRDLAKMVAGRKFREDLFYRLNVFPIHVPPLRERKEDIPLLARHFTRQIARRMNKTIDGISAETMDLLLRYDWPGNIRELQNVIERSVIVSPGPELQISLSELKQTEIPERAKHETLEETERKHILSVLNATNWVLGGPNGAAVRLGLKRSTLQFRMKKLGIDRFDRTG